METSRKSFRWVRTVYKLRRGGSNFFGSQWAGGVMLVVFTIIALIVANWGVTKEVYHRILEFDMGFRFGSTDFTMNVETWINDALMAIFFFVVGLEIKREMMVGRLSNIRHALLPVAGALGGMLIPAGIYLAFNAGTQFEHGFGIPTATDIAFAIGVLSLLGNKVPISLKVFLTALAIVDDLGAIVIVAVFYSQSINFVMLGAGIAILLVLYFLNKQGVTSVGLYLLAGIVVWFLFLHSGVHATISGVLLAMAIPTKPRFSRKYFVYKTRYFLEEFRFYDRPDKEVISNEEQMTSLWKMRLINRAAISPAQRLEHILSPVSTYIIMPVFALANAGVVFSSFRELLVFDTTMGTGIFLGLVIGKPLGIFLFSWLAIKTKLAAMPKGSTWSTMFCVCCLGGIGFTMSIFIDTLAFGGTEWVDNGKIAVLMASVTAAVLGALLFNAVGKRDKVRFKQGKLPKNQGVE
ncbi:Na+/H+ antiporter NhaA [Alistipes sp. OttesenSCG-928-B03]|nr:Na+/H+ antiporter NhaA [Alistipes sp. OttesenSCG-928-B03]